MNEIKLTRRLVNAQGLLKELFNDECRRSLRWLRTQTKAQAIAQAIAQAENRKQKHRESQGIELERDAARRGQSRPEERVSRHQHEVADNKTTLAEFTMLCA